MEITFESVRDVLAEQNGDMERENILETSNLREDLGLDSLDRTELVLALEERFHVMIDDDKVDEAKTVGDIVNLLRPVQ